MASISQLRAALLLTLTAPAALDAQQRSAHVSVPITITVRPTLAIRSVVPAPTGDQLTSTAIVNVDSNLPYRLSVRLAPTAANVAHVLVRGADGGFEPLLRGASITTVVSPAPGQRGHEVACRVEPAVADRCVLIYELSAEHDDVLVRSTAIVR
jgi:hypothetical protein